MMEDFSTLSTCTDATEEFSTEKMLTEMNLVRKAYNIPDKLFTGVDAARYLKTLAPPVMHNEATVSGYFGAFSGVPVVVDHDLPPDVLELRDRNGKILSRCVIGEKP